MAGCWRACRSLGSTIVVRCVVPFAEMPQHGPRQQDLSKEGLSAMIPADRPCRCRTHPRYLRCPLSGSLVVLLNVIVLWVAPALEKPASDSPIPVGSEKQLLFDNRFIDSSEGVAVTMNPPVKRGVVLACDRPWEDFRLTGYFTVLQEASGSPCRMYYSCFSKDQWHTPDAWVTSAFLCYAESKDGIHWEKPSLGLVEFEGSKDNNILLKSVVDGTVFVDPNAPPERRYKLLSTVGPHKGGLRVSYSPDAVHFTTPEQAVSPWEPDSQQNAFWDPRLEKYAVYLRGRPDMGFDVKNRLVVRVEMADIEKPWEVKPEIVFSADSHDLAEVDFYTNACVKYPWAPHAYLM